MARRTYALCQFLVEHYDGDARADLEAAPVGRRAVSPPAGAAGLRRREDPHLHGHPRQAAGHEVKGWEEAAAPFSDDVPRSVADIDSAEGFARVREFKKAKRAAGKQKTD